MQQAIHPQVGVISNLYVKIGRLALHSASQKIVNVYGHRFEFLGWNGAEVTVARA
jgi:hypothetical protein